MTAGKIIYTMSKGVGEISIFCSNLRKRRGKTMRKEIAEVCIKATEYAAKKAVVKASP